jgi:uncharacterized protein YdcH (DUF465 family)
MIMLKGKIHKIKSILEMHESLMQSIDEAGGTWHSMTIDEIMDMTLGEVYERLAANNIRFCRVVEDDGMDDEEIDIDNLDELDDEY